MPPRKQPSAQPPQSRDDEVVRLTDAVGVLSQEIHVLREAIDDIRMELEWTTRNLRVALSGLEYHATAAAHALQAGADHGTAKGQSQSKLASSPPGPSSNPPPQQGLLF